MIIVLGLDSNVVVDSGFSVGDDGGKKQARLISS